MLTRQRDLGPVADALAAVASPAPPTLSNHVPMSGPNDEQHDASSRARPGQRPRASCPAPARSARAHVAPPRARRAPAARPGRRARAPGPTPPPPAPTAAPADGRAPARPGPRPPPRRGARAGVAPPAAPHAPATPRRARGRRRRRRRGRASSARASARAEPSTRRGAPSSSPRPLRSWASSRRRAYRRASACSRTRSRVYRCPERTRTSQTPASSSLSGRPRGRVRGGAFVYCRATPNRLGSGRGGRGTHCGSTGSAGANRPDRAVASRRLTRARQLTP